MHFGVHFRAVDLDQAGGVAGRFRPRRDLADPGGGEGAGPLGQLQRRSADGGHAGDGTHGRLQHNSLDDVGGHLGGGDVVAA